MSIRSARSGWPAMLSKNSAHSAERPASVMSPVTRTRSSGRAACNFLEAGHHPPRPFVAARSAPPALDAEAIALADDMDVGEMRHPPDPPVRRRAVEPLEVERLVRAGVGESPDERGCGEVGRHDDDGVGERGQDQLERRGEIRRRSDPPRRRPNGDRDQGGDQSEEDSGAGAAHRPHARELGAALGFSARSARWRIASRHKAYPG